MARDENILDNPLHVCCMESELPGIGAIVFDAFKQNSLFFRQKNMILILSLSFLKNFLILMYYLILHSIIIEPNSFFMKKNLEFIIE